jgi:PAT family beta-lactamase induction signal transducer AmpG
MAASMMLPGLVAGLLQEALGYPRYFGLVFLCGLATAAAVLIARHRLPPDFGRK